MEATATHYCHCFLDCNLCLNIHVNEATATLNSTLKVTTITNHNCYCTDQSSQLRENLLKMIYMQASNWWGTYMVSIKMLPSFFPKLFLPSLTTGKKERCVNTAFVKVIQNQYDDNEIKCRDFTHQSKLKKSISSAEWVTRRYRWTSSRLLSLLPQGAL